MRIEQLECVAAVTRLGSMRQASRELHISQPALSETIRNLEKELGVTLLERLRGGARISDAGRELLPYLTEILDLVDRLRAAASQQHRTSRMIRIGTVQAATAALLTPALSAVRALHADLHVSVRTSDQAEIHQALLEGRLDLGLVNLLAGDDVPTDIETVSLLTGRVVVCCRNDSRFAASATLSLDDLAAGPLIAMRSGYVMHRYLHRLARGRDLPIAYTADGAEMGKLMVADGLGVTLLPDYSIVDDPLERSGVITYRPLADTSSTLVLALQHRREQHLPAAVRQVKSALTEQATSFRAG